MNLDSFIARLDSDSSSGPNLEYEKAFTELERAAQPGEERQIGDSIVEATEPDWKVVRDRSLAVLERSHDLRAAVYLAEAGLKLGGFADFARTSTYMRGIVERFWPSFHPELAADENDDPTMRVNALLGLTNSQRVLRAVRSAPLTASRTFGGFGLQAIQVARNEIPAPEGAGSLPDITAIDAAFRDTAPEMLARIADDVATAHADITAIKAKFDAELAAGDASDLDPILNVLAQIQGCLTPYLTDGAVPLDGAGEAGQCATGAAAADSAARPAGPISGPSEVIEALERIIDYYAHREPSSPVPLLLLRAKRLVNADFFTVMKDVAPDGVNNVRLVAGLPGEDE